MGGKMQGVVRRPESSILIIVALLLVSGLGILILPMLVPVADDHPPQMNPAPVVASHLTHSTIVIDGDDGFTVASGVISGSGVLGDPYVIEGWQIAGVGAKGAAILVNSTTAHFVIRDVVLTSNGSGTGIQLIHTSNATVDNAIVSGFYDGIRADSSNDGVIISCAATNCTSSGVYLNKTVNVTVLGCVLMDNSYGIFELGFLVDPYRHFSGNTIAGNDYGIWASLPYLIVTDNRFNFNRIGLRYGGGWATVTDNLFSDSTSYAIMIVGGGPQNNIWNNTYVRNNGASEIYDTAHIQAYDDGANTNWDVGGYGNYWDDWKSPDADTDGIVDVPYAIADNPVHPVAGNDHYPQTVPTMVPEASPVLMAAASVIAVALGHLVTRGRRGH